MFYCDRLSPLISWFPEKNLHQKVSLCCVRRHSHDLGLAFPWTMVWRVASADHWPIFPLLRAQNHILSTAFLKEEEVLVADVEVKTVDFLPKLACLLSFSSLYFCIFIHTHTYTYVVFISSSCFWNPRCLSRPFLQISYPYIRTQI